MAFLTSGAAVRKALARLLCKLARSLLFAIAPAIRALAMFFEDVGCAALCGDEDGAALDVQLPGFTSWSDGRLDDNAPKF